jgi:hypothetical protein
MVLFETYDFTKACFGVLLLGLGTVALGVKEKGTHSALGPVGILHHGERRKGNKRMVRN